MRSDVFLEVIFATKSLATVSTRVGPNTCVDEFVSSEFFVARESFVAIINVANKRALARVDSDVILELAIVREGHLARWTLEVFWPALFGVLALVGGWFVGVGCRCKLGAHRIAWAAWLSSGASNSSVDC